LESICTFRQSYYDHQYRSHTTFECKIERIQGKDKCLFHDETYLKDDNHQENKDKVIEKLQQMIEESISKNRPLYCIGYYLPNIEIDKEFIQPIYFNHCNFQKANFIEAIFSAEAIFTRATFSAEANFSSTTFKGKVDFTLATFSAEAQFYYTTFKEAIFNNTTFKEESILIGATFSAEANFSGSIFKGKVDFTLATFSAITYFTRATFSAEANFSSTTFKENTYFHRPTFSDATYFSGKFQGWSYFNYVSFGKPNEVRFEIEDMSLVSFMNTDITRIRFSGKTRWSKDGQFKVIEEENLEKALDTYKEIESNLEEILSVYRNLRENYEFRRRYDEAGKFFIREMELKRKYRGQIKGIFIWV